MIDRKTAYCAALQLLTRLRTLLCRLRSCTAVTATEPKPLHSQLGLSHSSRESLSPRVVLACSVADSCGTAMCSVQLQRVWSLMVVAWVVQLMPDGVLVDAAAQLRDAPGLDHHPSSQGLHVLTFICTYIAT